MDIQDVMSLKKKAEVDIVNIIRNLNAETGLCFDDLKFVCNKYLSDTEDVLNINYKCSLRPNLDEFDV